MENEQPINVHVQGQGHILKTNSQPAQPLQPINKLAPTAQEGTKATAQMKKHEKENIPPTSQSKKIILYQKDIKRAQTLIGGNTKITNILINKKQINDATIIKIYSQIATLGLSLNPITETDSAMIVIGAVQNNYPELLNLLLASGVVNPNARNKEGETALMCAVKKGNKDVVELLINANADINAPTVSERDSIRGMTALMYAILSNKQEIAQMLIQRQELDVNARSANGCMALTAAITMGQEDIVHALLKAGADLTLKTGQDDTALMIAARIGSVAIITALIEAEAALDPQIIEQLNEREFSQEEIFTLLNSLQGISIKEVDPLIAQPLTALIEKLKTFIFENLEKDMTHIATEIAHDTIFTYVPICMHDVMEHLCNNICAGPESLPEYIRDDEMVLPKQEIIDFLLLRLKTLDSEDTLRGETFEQSIKIKSMLSNIINNLNNTKSKLDNIADKNERSAKTKLYYQKLRTVVIGLGVAFRHCSARNTEAIEKFYWTYVNQDQDSAEQHITTRGFKNHVLKSLLELRETLFQNALDANLDDVHLASTARSALAQPLGLRSLDFMNLNDDLKQLLDPIIKKFMHDYNPRMIIEQIRKFILTPTKDYPYKMYKKWYKNYCKTQNPPLEYDENALWNTGRSDLSLKQLYLFVTSEGICKEKT